MKQKQTIRRDLALRNLRFEKYNIHTYLYISFLVSSSINHIYKPCLILLQSEWSNKIDGRRIVDVSFFLQQIQNLNDHGSLFNCSFSHMSLISEKRVGLFSYFKLKCNMCSMEGELISDKRTNDVTVSSLDVNRSAVSGIMSIGSGFSHLEEFMSNLEIPCMSVKYYSKIHKEIFEKWQETAIEEMEKAVRREREAAIEEGRIDKDGRAMIDVIADGCWSKRSYGKNFSAFSGAAAIIGRKFGEVLFMSVRNKYCCMCARYLNKKMEVPVHDCYKNFSGSSSSMESDVLVEGFNKSIEMHNVIYSTIIADGDSSTYQKILQARPYLYHTVEKIECKNHIFRNFCNKLKLLTTDTRYKLQARKCITSEKILKMRRNITSAIAYNKCQNISMDEKIDCLYNDILNAPLHAFGNHEKCRSFLNCLSENETLNAMSCLKGDIIWERIRYITQNVAMHARSLIHDVDSNVVERFNGIIAKFVGGKRINYIQKQSYQARCNAAVISFNTKQPLSTLHKKYIGRSPSGRISKVEKRRQRQLSKSIIYKRKKNRKFLEKTSNSHYGEHCNQPDVPSEIFEKRKTLLFQELENRKNDRSRIEKLTVLQSESSEWLELRRKMVTASNFGKIINRLQHTKCANLVKSMLYGRDLSNVASICHGKENEKTALKQLSCQEKVEIQPCGLFIDPKFPFLGATPDGISEDYIFEVKCPITAHRIGLMEAIRKRKVTFWKEKDGKLEINIKHHWYIQVQGQLHITGKKVCLFAVWSGENNLLKTEYIQRDDLFWTNVMEKKLVRFYMDCVVPEIIDPRVRRNMDVREPEYILEAAKKRNDTIKRKKSVTLPCPTPKRQLVFSDSNKVSEELTENVLVNNTPNQSTSNIEKLKSTHFSEYFQSTDLINNVEQDFENVLSFEEF